MEDLGKIGVVLALIGSAAYSLWTGWFKASKKKVKGLEAAVLDNSDHIAKLIKETAECRKDKEDCHRNLAEVSRVLLRVEAQKSAAHITLNAKRQISEWDAAAVLLFLYERIEVVGKTIEFLMEDYMKALHVAAMDEADKKNIIRRDPLATVALDRNGNEVLIWVQLKYWTSSEGRCYGATIWRRYE